ncbi:MAG: PIN domain-containing protein [Candidatus Brockarchaeota archaeon]|nr:PIN domain-containing protein [Candidatus Brockarchaeota archaeon]
MRIVAGSYAWVELFIGSQKGRTVMEKFSGADEIYTPDIVLAELARKYRRERVEADVVKARLSKIFELSRIVPVDKNVAVRAAELDYELRKKARETGLKELGLFDAIVLAVAEVLGASLITGDEHFRGRPEVVWIRD